MTEHGMVGERLMELIASSSNQRLRPNALKQMLARELDVSAAAVKAVVRQLVEQGDLVYSYRDPCSYLEIPGS